MGQAPRSRHGNRRRQQPTPSKGRRESGAIGQGKATSRTGGFPYGLAVFSLALVVRLIYLYESSANPTFAVPIMDSSDYDSLGRSLVDGTEPSTSLFWQPVFYPLFLAVVYGLTGSSILAAKLIQVVLGSLTCLLTFRLGRRIFDLRTGLVAGVVTALYGPLIFFETELLATGWAAFWSVVLVLLFLKAADAKKPGLALALGICGALSIITRPTFVPVFLAGCVWLAVVWRRGGKAPWRVVRGGVTILAGFLVIAAPVGALNHRLTGHLGILPASGGVNFYIGNNPAWEQTVSYRPGRDWGALLALPGQHGVTGGPWDRQRFFYSQALGYMRSEPAAFLRGLVHKGIELISAREMPRSLDLYVFREWSPTLSGLAWKAGRFGFPFGVLLPLALVGWVHQRRRIPGPVWLLLTLYPLSIILVFVAARYRTPLVPVISVLAAAGCLALVTALRSRDLLRLATHGGLVAAAVAVSCLPGSIGRERINYAAELHRLLANRFFTEQRIGEAIQEYTQALEFTPDDPDIHGKLGEALLRQERIEEAIVHYRASLRVRPNSATNRACLGIALQQNGQLEQAIAEYRKAVALDREFAKAYSNLGVVLQQSGRLDEAIHAYQQAALISPGEATIFYNLGTALARRGDLEAAVQALRRSLEVDPNNADVRHELALALYRQGKRDEATVEADRALQIDPHHQPARALLDSIHRRQP